MQLKGTTFLVTGGASGLGEGTVRMLVANGANAVIADVQAACEAPETAFELLQLLVGTGSLVVGHGIPIGSVFRNELRRLVRCGVLQTSNMRYSVTPAYRQALRNLQLSGVGFVWGTRVRRKRDS